PMRTFRVTDVGHALVDRFTFEREGRRWHTPTRHHHFPATFLVADNGRWVIRIDPGHLRQVARVVGHDLGEFANRRLTFDQRVKVAHLGHHAAVSVQGNRYSWRGL